MATAADIAELFGGMDGLLGQIRQENCPEEGEELTGEII